MRKIRKKIREHILLFVVELGAVSKRAKLKSEMSIPNYDWNAWTKNNASIHVPERGGDQSMSQDENSYLQKYLKKLNPTIEIRNGPDFRRPRMVRLID